MVYFEKHKSVSKLNKVGMSKIRELSEGTKSLGIYRNIFKYKSLLDNKKKAIIR